VGVTDREFEAQATYSRDGQNVFFEQVATCFAGMERICVLMVATPIGGGTDRRGTAPLHGDVPKRIKPLPRAVVLKLLVGSVG
jgi:hypothetical protein